MHACFPHKSTENEQARRESPRLRGESAESTRAPMEMKLSTTSGEASSGGCKKKRPPSRLQKHAPATLRLEPPAAPSPTGAWGDGRTPIPLLSPLVVSPSAAWEAVDQQAGAPRREGGVQGGGVHPDARSGREGSGAARAHGCNGDRQADDAAKAPAPCGGGWRHPALPTPVAEPASLVPFFQSQCALEVHNAQQ
ncbi:hypothetical protein E2562_012085 [Oryza meyeriana var. granulata]|uniref:Uncharacterized protein n=1 Tax=Oryza meyeriana var. granulata TaxID=110450 RepID=A0A6G1F7A2_9ORYZ|nr:hypothetical protein E2562_012085 [Oryza meyeriana var. granulata]